MNRNEKKPSARELEAIGVLGGNSLHELTSNYSEAEIEVLEERFLMKKELFFWELGYKYKWLLFAFCSAFGLFFSWKAEAVHGWILTWNFSNTFIYGVLGFGGALVTFSLIDIGRICFFFKSRKEVEDVDPIVSKVAEMMCEEKSAEEEVDEVEEAAEEEEEVEVEEVEDLQEEEEVEEADLLEEEVEVVEEKKSFLALCFCLLEGLQDGEEGEKMSCSEIAKQLNLNAANSLIGRAMGACKFVCMRQKGMRFWKVRIARKVGLLEVSPTCDS